jgi:hypothetical protein
MNCNHTYKPTGINQVTCITCGDTPTSPTSTVESEIEKMLEEWKEHPASKHISKAEAIYNTRSYAEPFTYHENLQDFVRRKVKEIAETLEKESYERGKNEQQEKTGFILTDELEARLKEIGAKQERQRLSKKVEEMKVDLTEPKMQHMKMYNLALDDLLKEIGGLAP